MGNDESVKNVLRRIPGRFTGHGSFVVIFATALLVLLAGFWEFKQAGKNVESQMRLDLISQVSGVAATINPSNLRALSYTADDKSRPEFSRLCDQMHAYAQIAGIDSLYTMALRNGHIVFGPESLAEGDPHASQPGTVYQNPSAQDYDFFVTGSPQIQGPRTDEYGTFVTALAPVLDPRTGEVLAAVGIDVDVSVWKSAVWRAQWVPAILTLVLLLVLLLSWLTLKHRQRYSPLRHERKRRSEIILCAVFFTLLTVLLVVQVNQNEYAHRRDTFQQLAQAHAAVCTQEFFDLRNRLNQLVYFFESSQDVTRDEFAIYCRHLVEQGILEACVWMPAVPDSEAGLFVQTVRAAGLPDFSIWQKNQAGVNEPAAHRPVYYPALYIEPLDGHVAGLGYDLNSEPARRAAMQDALSTGLATATDPVRLIALTNSPSGIFIFAPVKASVQKGLVAFALRPENLLGGAQHKGRRIPDVRVCMIQLQNGKDPLFVTGSSGQCGLSCLENTESDLAVTVPVFRFGKAYVLRLVPDPVWLAAHPLQHGWIAGCFGSMLTLLVSLIVAMVVNRRVNLEKKIAVRTAELLSSKTVLKQREAYLSAIIENQPGLVWLKDKESRFLAVNRAFAKACGCQKQADLIGRTDIDVWPPELAEKYRRDDRAVMGKGSSVMVEEMICDKGEMRWFETFKTPVFSSSGDIVGTTGFSRDITERKQAEAALQMSQQLTERIINTIPVRVFWKDRNFVYLGCNDAFAQDAGFAVPAEVIGKEDCQMAWRDRAELYRKDDREVIESGTGKFLIEELMTKPDGKTATVLTTKVPLRDAAGEICGMLGTYIDITERKMAQEELNTTKALLQTAMNQSPAGIAIADAPDGKLRYVNDAGLFIRGGTREEEVDGIGLEQYVSSWHLFELDGTPLDSDLVPLTRAIKYGEVNSREFIIRRADHDDRIVFADAAPIINEQGHITAGMVVFLDITERKQTEEKLKQKYDELDRFNKVTVGREIRMIELKKEINELLKAAGQPKKYVIAGEDK